MPTKPALHLLGPKPTLEDLIKLAKALTGRDPTAEEIATAKKIYGL